MSHHHPLWERIAAARRAQQAHTQRHDVQLELNMEMDEITKQQLRDAGRGHLLRDSEILLDYLDPEEEVKDASDDASSDSDLSVPDLPSPKGNI